MSATQHTGLVITATLVIRDSMPALEIAGIVYGKLTWQQFAQLCQEATASFTLPKVPQCDHRNIYDAPCIKALGHDMKHQYIRKTFKKKEATIQAAPEVQVSLSEPNSTVIKRHSVKRSSSADYKARGKKVALAFARKRKEGICLRCSDIAEEGKAYCKHHLKEARASAKIMRAGKKV